MAGLPANVNFGTVTGRLITAEQIDTAEPDGLPITGKVTFRPTPPLIIDAAADTLIVPKAIQVNLDVTGAFSTQLVATDDVDLNPSGWTYEVSFQLNGGVSIPSFHITVPTGSTRDLADIAPVPGAGGVYYVPGGSDADVAARIAGGAATQAAGDARWQRSLGVLTGAQFGMVGNDATDNSAAFATALLAAAGKTLHIGPGIYRLNSATRALIDDNFTTIQGDPSGVGTILKFMNAAGGLDIGDGANNVYENRLKDITISGNNTATQLVRCRKMYEPYFSGVRLENFAAGGVALTLDECGQLDADRLVLSNGGTGIKITGATPPLITLRLSNWFQLTKGAEIASAGIASFVIRDSWMESVGTIIDLNRPGNPISIGELRMKARVLNVGAQRLLKATAFSGMNAVIIDFSDTYVEASASTVPLIDFSTLAANTGTINFTMNDAFLYTAAGAKPYVQVHADQFWWLFKAEMQRCLGPAGNLDSSDLFENPIAAGGLWAAPQVIHGVGSPEGVVDASPGSIFRASDLGKVYVKTSGSGNTAWFEMAVLDGFLAEFIRDTMGIALVSGTGVDVQVDDAANTITVREADIVRGVGGFSRVKPTPAGASNGLFALAKDPNNANRLWVQGQDFGQLGYTDDGGGSWVPKVDLGALVGAVGIHQLTFEDGYAYLLVGNNASKNGQLWRSPAPDANGNGLNFVKKFDLAAPPGGITTGTNSCFRPNCFAVIGAIGYLLEYSINPSVTGGPSIYATGNRGDTWAKTYTWANAKHGHAVAIAGSVPVVTLGDSGVGWTDIGFQRATTVNADSWSQVSSFGEAIGGNTNYGIKPIPATIAGKVCWLLEYDGGRNFGPLVYPDNVAGVATKWPLEPLCKLPYGYFGTNRSIIILSNGNLMWANIAENGAFGAVDSIWVLKGPNYDGKPVLVDSFPTGTMPWGDAIQIGNEVWMGWWKMTIPRFIGQ